MSLIESARGFVKGLGLQDPEVGELDSSARGHREADGSQAACGDPSRMGDEAGGDESGVDGVDDVERLRREWDTQPGHH